MTRRQGVSLLKGGAFIIYELLKLLPVQKKLVLISRINSSTSIDFQRLADEAQRLQPSLTVKILNHKMTNRAGHVFAVLQEMYHLATAKSCIVESYVIPVSILTHRPTLTIIQIWHALGAVKTFGHTAKGKAEGSSVALAELMHMHRNYTYVTAGSKQTVPIFAKAFDMHPSRIIPIGMPRADYLLDNTVQTANTQKIRSHYNLSGGKPVILYAPTFRKGSKLRYEDFIAHVDTAKFNVIIKQHPVDKTVIKHDGAVIVDKTFDLLELLPVADFIITDYSAVVFEAAILGKPLFFWMFDKEKYSKRRGYSMDVRELPGVKSTDIQSILSAINGQDFDTEQIKQFAAKYVEVQDGTSTKQILHLSGAIS